MKKVTLLGLLAACVLLATPVLAAAHRHHRHPHLRPHHRYTHKTHYTPPRGPHKRIYRTMPHVTSHYTPPGAAH